MTQSRSLNDKLKELQERSRAIHLVEYLSEVSALNSRTIHDIKDYRRVFWFHDVSNATGSLVPSAESSDGMNHDIWLELSIRPEPPFPPLPESLSPFIDTNALRNSVDTSTLFKESVPADQLSLAIQQDWDDYIRAHWKPWAQQYSIWKKGQNAYSALFEINQEILRLGEEYELIVGFGLLSLKTNRGTITRRHILVADAALEFEPEKGTFRLHPNHEGAMLRVELDMIDPEDLPQSLEQKTKVELTRAGDDPSRQENIETTLKTFIHSLDASGEYSSSWHHDFRTASYPRIEYAPALILRKRSTRGLTDLLQQMKDQMASGCKIPSEFLDLAEPSDRPKKQSETDPLFMDPDEEMLYFPKPSNEEQRCIAQSINQFSGVLVQGPPGTGKSHTIANLICHLLATGKRTLITAKTPRALEVLERLVPSDLRPLFINLLGSSIHEKKSLETSISRILRKIESWDEDSANKKRLQLKNILNELNTEKRNLELSLMHIREKETQEIEPPGCEVKGTPAFIVKTLHRDRDLHDWFNDPVPKNIAPDELKSQLFIILKGFRRFSAEKQQELDRRWPENLPSDTILSRFLAEKSSSDKAAHQLEGTTNIEAAQILSSLSEEMLTVIRDALAIIVKKMNKVKNSRHSWVSQALQDSLDGDGYLWDDLCDNTNSILNRVESVIHLGDSARYTLPDNQDIRALFRDFSVIKTHLENGGNLGWGPFRSGKIRNQIKSLKAVTLNDRPIRTCQDVVIMTEILELKTAFQSAWQSWRPYTEPVKSNFSTQMHALKSMVHVLEDVHEIITAIETIRQQLSVIHQFEEPDWTDSMALQEFVNCSRYAFHIHRIRYSEKAIHDIERKILAAQGCKHPHPVSNELLQAIRSENLDNYVKLLAKIKTLDSQRKELRELRTLKSKLAQTIPNSLSSLLETVHNPLWDERIDRLNKTFEWMNVRHWLAMYLEADDVASISDRIKQIENKTHDVIAKLAALHAWSFCFSRLKPEHRQHMQAWQQAMNRLGKGTGKHAPWHRREAQKHLNMCREAVPAWVMPIHRIWDTVKPGPGIFDVIIVDEASQCGLESLPLFFLARKILIVGDDKQISPEAVGLAGDAIHHLMEKYLSDLKFSTTFEMTSSLFDHAKLRYGSRRITLREHFRCMPEIIRFSNELCYSDTPLIPMRQYTPDRLSPLEHVYVEDGVREGSGSNALNIPEANAVVERIVEFCDRPEYASKSMGVIVMQGEAQAGYIENRLLSTIGADEIARRRIICGNPYSFQGDERDVMFLSLVAARNMKIGTLTKQSDVRRFNVAASRSKDQLLLFHSVQADDLSDSGMRRKLLEFFTQSEPFELETLDPEKLNAQTGILNRNHSNPPEPFETWFEVDVAFDLLNASYRIIPKYSIAGTVIDMVAVCGDSLLAIECDGDTWKGAADFTGELSRQRQLERCGWEFYRLRESLYYLDREVALDGLWNALKRKGIYPAAEESGAIDRTPYHGG